MVSRSLFKNNPLIVMGQAALIMLFGMQLLRAFLALILYVLRDRMGWNALQVGGLAVALFLTSFLAPFLRRWLGLRRLFIVTASGLGLMRFLTQLWTGDPVIDLYVVGAGVVCFHLCLPAYLGYGRSHTDASAKPGVLGLIWGLAVDTVSHAAYGTYDMMWQTDWTTTGIILGLVLVQWYWLRKSTAHPADEQRSDGAWSQMVPLLVWGPFLFLQMLVFQNMARLAALTGWSQPAVLGCLVLSQVLGLFTAVWGLQRPDGRVAGRLMGLAGLVLVLLFIPGWPGGIGAALVQVGGQVMAVLLITAVLNDVVTGKARPGLSHLAITYGLGMVVMVTLLFMYYIVYELPVPFPNTALPLLAAMLLGIGGYRANRTPTPPAAAPSLMRWAWLLALILILIPGARLLTLSEPVAVPPDGRSLRVFTFNLHNGFHPGGHLNLEAIAQVIEREQPDVVALQEVSRGWVIAGTVDMMTWLSERLAMPYRFAPTADPQWGNALLSRYPILDEDAVALPPDDLLLKRGFVWAQIDFGEDEPMNVIVTHLHHLPPDGAIRVEQVQTILTYWQGRGATILMGDLNAVPDTPEMELLHNAGFIDAIEAAGIEPGYTVPSVAPDRRFDYIWVSPDLTVDEVLIPPDIVSDHLGVVATGQKAE